MRLSLFTFATAAALVVSGCSSVATTDPVDAASAAPPASVASPDKAQLRLFAVEVKVGPNWDTSKPPHEQVFFAEHSANLKRLRDAGHIIMGARYSDVGLILFSAGEAEEVVQMMLQDPSMEAGTFKYEVHSFNVFYPGMVQR